MVNSCCVTGCKNESYPGSSFSFHRFSKNENQKLNWGNAVPGKFTKSSVVCSAHFKRDDFIPGYTRKMLKPDAVPSIFPKVVTRALRKEFWVRGAIIFTEIKRAKRVEQSFGKSVFEKKLLNVWLQSKLIASSE